MTNKNDSLFRPLEIVHDFNFIVYLSLKRFNLLTNSIYCDNINIT